MEEYQLNFEEIHQNHLKSIADINKNRLPIIIITDGINDVGNIGMIFRLADAVRIEKIFLINLKENFNFKLLKKKSRSTSDYVSFEIIKDLSQIKKIKGKYKFLVLDKTNKSINYSELIPEFPICLIIGSEKFGVSEELIKYADTSVHIPMLGINTSINAATATAVVLYEITNKYQKT